MNRVWHDNHKCLRDEISHARVSHKHASFWNHRSTRTRRFEQKNRMRIRSQWIRRIFFSLTAELIFLASGKHPPHASHFWLDSFTPYPLEQIFTMAGESNHMLPRDMHLTTITAITECRVWRVIASNSFSLLLFLSFHTVCFIVHCLISVIV